MAPHETMAARFALLCGHLVATGLVARRPLPEDDKEAASATGARTMAYLGFAIAIAAFGASVDVLSPSTNTVHALCHFLGGVMVCRQIIYALPATYLWNVVAIAHLPSVLCSLNMATRRWLLKRT